MDRVFYNMQMFNDYLFQNFEPGIPEVNGYFFPVAYVKREFTWTQE